MRNASKVGVFSAAAIGIAAVLVGAYVVVGARHGAAEPERQVGPEQLLIVRDGSVSDQEYLQATGAMVGCLRDAGLAVSDPERGPQGLYGYRYLEGAATLDVDQERAAVVQSCYGRNLGEVDRVRQLSPDHQQSAEEMGFSIQRCVEAHKSSFRFSGDSETLIRQIVAFEAEGDADFRACWSENVHALFAANGQVGGGFGITYHPLPR